MNQEHDKEPASAPESNAMIDIIAASIHEQFGALGEAVVQQQLDGAEGSALVIWQAISSRLADLQGRRE